MPNCDMKHFRLYCILGFLPSELWNMNSTLQKGNHQKSLQEHIPSRKWWNLLRSLTMISLFQNLEINLIAEWQSSQTLRFFMI